MTSSNSYPKFPGKHLHERVAIVTGATSGIGEAVARQLIEAGATVCFVGRNETKLQQLEHTMGPNAHGYVVDFQDNEQLHEFNRSIKRQWKHVDILVHAAGLYSAGEHLNPEQADFIFEVNLTTPKVLTAEFLPLLAKSHGDIVFINSSAVRKTESTDPYVQSKIKLREYADALRNEVNSQGIRVLSVYPGRTASPMQELIHKNEGKPYKPEELLQPDDIARAIVAAVSLPRTAEVTDLHIRPFRVQSNG